MQLKQAIARVSVSTVLSAAAALLCNSLLAARAEDVPPEQPKLAEDIHETIVKLPVTLTLFSGQKHTGEMIVTHFRPKGAGPFPIVVINHGRASAKEKRAAPPRYRYTVLARYWIRRGFAVFVPTRLGYGQNGIDPDVEYSGSSCNDRKYQSPLAAMLKQTHMVLDLAKTLPWADTTRILVTGQSYGGFAAIGASGEKWSGVLAAINFAGGAGGDPERRMGNPCAPTVTARLIADAGKRANVPMLWLYAQNDKYWGAEWPRKWHAAYSKGGGQAEFVMFPPIADDGHSVASQGMRLWRPVLDRFLEKLGFPRQRSKDAPPPTGFAHLEEADKLPYVKDTVKTDGYQKFLDADVPRAFVISTVGVWVWRSGDNATERALERCREISKGFCQLYAIDDTVVWKAPKSAAPTAAP